VKVRAYLSQRRALGFQLNPNSATGLEF
jgi:hypothetical protein